MSIKKPAGASAMQEPSKQEQDVYHACRIEGRTAAEVAEMTGRSPVEVRAICRQVEAFKSANIGDWLERFLSPVEVDRRNQAVLADFDEMAAEALQAWHASFGPQVTHKIYADGRTVTTTKTGRGDPRYLKLYEKLVCQRAQLEVQLARLLQTCLEQAKRNRQWETIKLECSTLGALAHRVIGPPPGEIAPAATAPAIIEAPAAKETSATKETPVRIPPCRRK
jgi:hypothetical protein